MNRLKSIIPNSFTTGNLLGGILAIILVFSGSLYTLALSGYRSLGMLTPLGGVAFLMGWGFLARGYGKVSRHRDDSASESKRDS